MPRPPRAAQVRTSRRALRLPALTVTAAAVGALVLSGCQLTSPMQTLVPYEPADGVSVSLGDLQIRDLLIVASEKDAPGALSGLVLNEGSQPMTVSFGSAAQGAAAVTTEVPPGVPTHLSGGEGARSVTLPKVEAPPGGVVTLAVSTPAGGADQVDVPVLLPDGYYRTITPTPQAAGAVPSTPAP